MANFYNNMDKINNIITKYSLLFGGIFSFYNTICCSKTEWEMLAWACASMFALSGFSQIVNLEKKLKDDEDSVS